MELEELRNKFRELRGNWFNLKLRIEGECISQFCTTDELNESNRADYDKITERILAGDKYPVAPYSLHSVDILEE